MHVLSSCYTPSVRWSNRIRPCTSSASDFWLRHRRSRCSYPAAHGQHTDADIIPVAHLPHSPDFRTCARTTTLRMRHRVNPRVTGHMAAAVPCACKTGHGEPSHLGVSGGGDSQSAGWAGRGGQRRGTFISSAIEYFKLYMGNHHEIP